MSEGGFDVDELLKMKKKSENLFGTIKDTKTGRFVSFPSVPKNENMTDDLFNKTPIQNQDHKKNNKTAFEYCSICNEAYRCKLEEDGFIELCPFQVASNVK